MEDKEINDKTDLPPQTQEIKAKKKFNFEKSGSIFLILGVVVFFISLLPIFSAIFIGLYYLILVMILFLSVFTLLLNTGFMNLFSGGENITDAINSLMPLVPYVMLGSSAFFVTSIVMYALSKHKGSKIAGIIISSLFLIGSVAGGIVMLVGMK